MVADVLIGVLEQDGVRQVFGLIGDYLNRWATRFAAAR
jgi:thiamine pyrophosphate-dependent acetolactate synthase large subunit-like protein